MRYNLSVIFKEEADFMIDKLKKLAGGKRIKIVGHKNPDFDSVASGILLEHFLRSIDVDAHFVCEELSDSHAIEALKYAGVDIGSYCERVEHDDLLFLVDHHATEYKNEVIGCIDHHPTEAEICFPMYINAPSSSCALLIFRLAEKWGAVFARSDVRLALMSIYMDTRSCKSTKFVSSDTEWIKETAKKYSFADELEAFEQFGYCMTDMSAPIEKIAENDIKEYTFNGERIIVSHVQALAGAENERILRDVFEYVERKRESIGARIWILMLSDPKRECTSLVRFDPDGMHTRKYSRLLSRSIDVIPSLEKEFNL